VALIARTSRRLSLAEAGRAALQRAPHISSDGAALEDEAADQWLTVVDGSDFGFVQSQAMMRPSDPLAEEHNRYGAR
jgi:DNA-binding transcriptional LysR family regulator